MTPEEFAKEMRKISDMIIELVESFEQTKEFKEKMTYAIEESKL